MKTLYKLDILILKFLPIVMVFSYLINTQCQFLGTTVLMITHYVGLVLAPIIFMYVSSYVFQFCNYHRMFIHYITIEQLINIFDWYYKLPFTDEQLKRIHLTLAIIFLIITIIMYIKNRKTIKCITRGE